MKDLPNVQPINMQPRVNMSKGGLTAAAIAAGRNLPGRAKDLANKILGRNRDDMADLVDNPTLADEAAFYGFGDDTAAFLKYIKQNKKNLGSRREPFSGFGFEGKPTSISQVFKNNQIRNIPGRGQPGSLVASARGAGVNDLMRDFTTMAVPVGAIAAADATQGFNEEASMQNMMFNSPEQMGKDLAGMKIGIEKVIQLASQKAQEIGAPITEYVGRAQRSYEDEMEAERMQQIDSEEGLQNVSLLFNQGGEASFPDLTGDGKVTQADILKGRGVYAEGDEVMMMQQNDMMAPGNQEIEASLMEVQGMQPDMQVLDQYVQMVTQMIQAGASEAEVIESLRQAGLDDDDIAAVFQAVMETMQGSMEQGGIDAELAQLG